MGDLPVMKEDGTPLIDDTHRGPAVNLAAWVTMTTTVLTVVTVLILRLVKIKTLQWNDLGLSFAMFTSIAFVISINYQVSYGLGSEMSIISPSQYESFQKLGYTSNFLYVLCVFFAKVSSVALLLNLAPLDSLRRPLWIMLGGCVIWVLVAVIGNAFQCSFPQPYLYTSGRCIDQLAFWRVVAVVDILLDLAIVSFPFFLVRNLRMSLEKKTTVCVAFGCRLTAVAGTIFRLVEMDRFFDRSRDLTLRSWLPTIATLVEVFLGILSASVPHLRPFMEGLYVGYLTGIVSEINDEQIFTGQHDAVARVESSRKPEAHSNGTTIDSESDFQAIEPTIPPPTPQRTLSTRTMGLTGLGRISTDSEGRRTWHRHRESSSSNGMRSEASAASRGLIINATTKWKVSYEDKGSTS